MEVLRHDDIDLLMRICDRMGYGTSYGRFVAEVPEKVRVAELAKERRKQDKRDAEKRKRWESKNEKSENQ